MATEEARQRARWQLPWHVAAAECSRYGKYGSQRRQQTAATTNRGGGVLDNDATNSHGNTGIILGNEWLLLLGLAVRVSPLSGSVNKKGPACIPGASASCGPSHLAALPAASLSSGWLGVRCATARWTNGVELARPSSIGGWKRRAQNISEAANQRVYGQPADQSPRCWGLGAPLSPAAAGAWLMLIACSVFGAGESPRMADCQLLLSSICVLLLCSLQFPFATDATANSNCQSGRAVTPPPTAFSSLSSSSSSLLKLSLAWLEKQCRYASSVCAACNSPTMQRKQYGLQLRLHMYARACASASTYIPPPRLR